MIARTLGGAGRLDYTVLGDPVNVAQRLQGEAGAGEIIVSAATVDAAGSTDLEAAGKKRLKGRRGLVETYRVEWRGAVPADQCGTTNMPPTPSPKTTIASTESGPSRANVLYGLPTMPIA